MNEVNFSIILNKLLEMDPVSGISVIFTLIFFLYSRSVIKSLEKTNKTSLEKVEEAYNESVKTLKEIVDSYIKKDKKDKK
jgi:hypothetical protein|nr:MAG TPA: hypothetical protein [Caudoviricetes sp.]